MAVPDPGKGQYNLSPQQSPVPLSAGDAHNPNQKIKSPVDYSAVGNSLGTDLANEIAKQKQAESGLPKLSDIGRTQTEVYNERGGTKRNSNSTQIVDKPNTIDEFKTKQKYLQQQRQIKKQLFAARAQMSILRARLGMENAGISGDDSDHDSEYLQGNSMFWFLLLVLVVNFM